MNVPQLQDAELGPAERAAIDAYTSEGGRSPAEAMLVHGIVFDGRQFRYDGYAYDRVADAIAYADLCRERRAERDDAQPSGPSAASQR